MQSLSDIINKRRLTPNQHVAVRDTMEAVIDKMSPQDMVSFYKHAMENPHYNTAKIRKEADLDPKQKILRHIRDNEKPEHLKVMADMIDSLPEEKQHMLKYWGKEFKRILADKSQQIGA